MDPNKSENNISVENEKSKDAKYDLALQLAQLREEQEQMKYEYKRKIDTYEAHEKYYNDEIEYWKKEHVVIKNELKSQSNKFEEDIIRLKNDHLEETSSISENLSQLKLENNKLTKQLQEIQNRTMEENIDFERVQELEDVISNLKEELISLNIQYKLLEHKCSELEEQNSHLMQENKEYEQCLDIKRDEVTKSNGYIMELQEEISVLRKELHDLENQPRDINTKGNSLFAEVYDSRVRIKEKFLILAAKYNRTIQEKESLSKEVKILRSEVASMRDIFNKDMKNFKPGNMFELSGDGDSMSAMRSLVRSYKEEIERLTIEEPPAEREYRYYEAVIQRQKKDIDKLRGILSEHTLTHSMKARKFSELGCEMAGWKFRASELESEKRYLDIKIEELENKILDLQAEQAKSDENKENEAKKENETNKENKKTNNTSDATKMEPESEKVPDPDEYKKSLIKRYGTDKVRIISAEEMKAIRASNQYVQRTEDESASKSEKRVEGNDIEKKSPEDSETGEDNSVASQSRDNDKEKRRGIRFADDTKKEDGERRRPRGKNSYVLNLQTNELRKVN